MIHSRTTSRAWLATLLALLALAGCKDYQLVSDIPSDITDFEIIQPPEILNPDPIDEEIPSSRPPLKFLGIFKADPNEILETPVPDEEPGVGDTIDNYYLKLYNFDPDELTVDVDFRQGTDIVCGIEAQVRGDGTEGERLALVFTTPVTRSDGETYIREEVIIGDLVLTGIRDFKRYATLLEVSEGIDDFIPVGGRRVFIDGDGLAERVTALDRDRALRQMLERCR